MPEIYEKKEILVSFTVRAAGVLLLLLMKDLFYRWAERL